MAFLPGDVPGVLGGHGVVGLLVRLAGVLRREGLGAVREHGLAEVEPPEAEPGGGGHGRRRAGGAEGPPPQRADGTRTDFPAGLPEGLAALDEARLHGVHHHRHDLVEQLAGLGLVDPQALVFHPRQPAAEAHDHPAAGQVVEHADLFGQAHRVVPGHHDHLGAEPAGLGPGRQPGQVLQRVGGDRIVREMVLGDPDGLETELFGQQQLGHLLAQELVVRQRGVVGESSRDADVHQGAPSRRLPRPVDGEHVKLFPP